MKLVTVILNVAMFVFTCFVLIAEGISRETGYIFLIFLLLFVPVFNLSMILSERGHDDWLDFHLRKKASDKQVGTDSLSSGKVVLKIAAIACNIILLGLSCWAFVSQYPHPRESGFILFTAIIFLTPIISLVALAYYKQ